MPQSDSKVHPLAEQGCRCLNWFAFTVLSCSVLGGVFFATLYLLPFP